MELHLLLSKIMRIKIKDFRNFKIFFIFIFFVVFAVSSALIQTRTILALEKYQNIDFSRTDSDSIITKKYNSQDTSDYDELIKQIQAMHGEIELLQHRQDEIMNKLDVLEKSIKTYDIKTDELNLQHSQNLNITKEENITDRELSVKKTYEEEISPEEQYQKAYIKLRKISIQTEDEFKKNIKEVENEFNQFISTYPKHPLVSNAYYWLGQISSKRKDYAQAIRYYIKGYESNPKKNRAQDNLIGMVDNFTITKQIDAACGTMSKFFSEFPTPKENLKNKIRNLEKKLHCQKLDKKDS